MFIFILFCLVLISFMFSYTVSTKANAGQQGHTVTSTDQCRPMRANTGQQKPTKANKGQSTSRPTRAHNSQHQSMQANACWILYKPLSYDPKMVKTQFAPKQNFIEHIGSQDNVDCWLDLDSNGVCHGIRPQTNQCRPIHVGYCISHYPNDLVAQWLEHQCIQLQIVGLIPVPVTFFSKVISNGFLINAGQHKPMPTNEGPSKANEGQCLRVCLVQVVCEIHAMCASEFAKQCCWRLNFIVSMSDNENNIITLALSLAATSVAAFYLHCLSIIIANSQATCSTSSQQWTDLETEAILQYFIDHKSDISDVGKFKKKTYTFASRIIPGQARTSLQVQTKWQSVSKAVIKF